MAVHFAAGLNYARRTAGGFLNPAAAGSTVMMWVKFGSVPAGPNYQMAYALLDDPAVYTDYVTMDAQNSANGLELAVSTTAGVQGAIPTAGIWYHLAWVQSGVTTQRFYINGQQIGTVVKNRAAFVIGYEMLGNDTFATSDISIEYLREWQTNLTTAQIQAEMQSSTAIVGGAFLNCPFTANLNDISGNARNFSLVGADSFVAGPSWPANSTAATAIEISGLPTSVTTDFQDGFYGWYTYQSVPADLEAGFLFRSNLTDTLTVTTKYGSASSLTTFGLPAVNQPLIVPTAGGDTWFFYVISPATLTDDLTVDAQLPPDEALAVGSIGVNDDGNYDANGTTPPAIFLDGNSGVTLRPALAAAGEAGAVLPTTGQVCLYDTLTGTVQIFVASLGTPEVTIPNASFFGSGTPAAISTDCTTQFYVGGFQSGTTCHVKTLSPTGTVGTTDYAITITAATNLRSLAPTHANTILYYADTGTGAAVRRWDLVNNVALSNLVAGVANHVIGEDILVLADGSIVVTYRKTTVATDYFVRRYDAAGATLNTYTFGATNFTNRKAMAIDDPDSFWVWLYLDDDPPATFAGSVSRFVNVNTADGSTLSSLDAVNFEGGHNSAEPEADPLRFGHSFSCPFWINRVGETPTPDVNVTEYLIRRERWFPVITKEQHRITAHLLQLYFEAGTGISTGQGSDPICELDWSDDGGHTWSNLHLIKTGKIGEYKRRAIRRMMGQFRERVYRVAVTDPVQWSLIDAFFQATEGTS